MLFQPGEQIGPYVIVAPVGAGGMGEVYKALDTGLGRTVALKTIGGGVQHRSDASQRFSREARAIAALNHPHICVLYNTGNHDGRNFLVLEYLEGETVADRLRRGAIPPKDLLQHAFNIASALSYAHQQGIVHRDLKPGNVFLSKHAGIKILDFGLAQLRAARPQDDPAHALATEPKKITIEGTIVGTLNYLAPERLDGREADARSDIFAFGAVLYEMATGRRAFDETTQARLIAAILSQEPAPLDDEAGVPAPLAWIVRHCLAKNPDDRWQSMADVTKVIKGVADMKPLGAVDTPHPRNQRWHWAAAVAGVLAVVLAGSSLLQRSRTSDSGTAPTALRLSVLPPTGSVFALTESTVKSTQFAMSPGGHALVFVARSGGAQQLWLRELNSTEARALPGTEDASYPFWSPDGRFIAFFADQMLKKVGLTGRPPQTICSAANGRGGAWGADDTIVFSPDISKPLFRVSAAGGVPTELTKLADGHASHRWPQFLPDGQLLLFVRSNDPEKQGIYGTSPADPGQLRLVRANGSSAIFAEGMLLYVLDGNLVAQPFDQSSRALSGEATPIGLTVSVSSAFNPAISASNHGLLATWSDSGLTELVWYDREGTRLGSAGPPDRYVDFRLSPDDRRLAISRVDRATNTPDVAVLGVSRPEFTRISSSLYTDATPVWSPDGSRVVFRSNRGGVHDLFVRPSDGGASEELLHSFRLGMYPTDWSPESGVILFHVLGLTTAHDIWMLDPAKPTAQPIQQTSADEVQGQLAPGGLFAYASNESGSMNVYTRVLKAASAPITVSTDGGFDPRWRADGRELFFISSTGWLMAAPVANDGKPNVLTAKRLFDTGIREGTPPFLSHYGVTGDGKRFLVNVPLDPPGSAPITISLNWPSSLAGGRR